MRGLHGVPMGVFGVLQRLPRTFPTCQVILFPMLLLGAAVGVCGDVMEFRRACDFHNATRRYSVWT